HDLIRQANLVEDVFLSRLEGCVQHVSRRSQRQKYAEQQNRLPGNQTGAQPVPARRCRLSSIIRRSVHRFIHASSRSRSPRRSQNSSRISAIVTKNNMTDTAEATPGSE